MIEPTTTPTVQKANIPTGTKHIVCFVINNPKEYAETKRLGTYRIMRVNVTQEEANRVKSTKGTVQVIDAFTAEKELYAQIKSTYAQIFVLTDKN